MSAILARQAEFCTRHGIRLAKGRSNSWLVWSAEFPHFSAVVLGRTLKRGKSRSVVQATDETFLALASPSILSAAPGSPPTETAVRVAHS
jgi:hypothetical protein